MGSLSTGNDDVAYAVLGPLQVGGVEPRVARQQDRLLGVLLLEAGRPVTLRDLHRFAIGGGATEPARVQVLVSRLRRLLAAKGLPGRVVTVPGGYRFDVPAKHLDAAVFEALVAKAGMDADRSLLREAVGLWRGDVLAGLGLQGHRSARRLVECRLDALELWADLVVRQGAFDELAPLADACRRSPARERLVALVMLGLAHAGRQREALAFAHDARAVLGSECGLEPGDLWRRTERAVLDLDAATALQALGIPAQERSGPRAGAVHRARPSVPSGVRVGGTAARDDLVAAVLESPLVSVVGPGGVGKTRLVFEAADVLEAARGIRVAVVELAAVARSADVQHVVAERLMLDTCPADRLAQAVGDWFEEAPSLLVLDNCEHLVDAVAAFVLELFGAGASRIATTSRRPLRVSGEQVIRLGPLPLEAAQELFKVRLSGRDRTSGCDEDAVEQICASLDCLPLAIELAAARASSVGLATVRGEVAGSGLGSVRARVARHRSLDELIGWSVAQLDETTRSLLFRCAVLVGEFDASLATAVYSPDEGFAEVVGAGLTELVEQSLLDVSEGIEPTRYRMLETVRRYALRQLGEDAAAVRAAYFGHVIQLLRAANGDAAAFGFGLGHRVDGIFHHVREAQRSLADRPAGPGEGARLLAALLPYAQVRPRRELSQWGDALLVGPTEMSETAARAHIAASASYHFGAEFPAAERHARRALEIDRNLGRPRARTLLHLAPPVAYQGRVEESYELASEALQLAEVSGGAWVVGASRYVHVFASIYAGCGPDLATVAGWSRGCGEPVVAAMSLGALGTALLAAGSPTAAEVLKLAVPAADDFDHTHLSCLHRCYLAMATGADDPRLALVGLRVALATYGALGLPYGVAQLAADCIPYFAALEQWHTVGRLAGAAVPVSIFAPGTSAAHAAALDALGGSQLAVERALGASLPAPRLHAWLESTLDDLGVPQPTAGVLLPADRRTAARRVQG